MHGSPATRASAGRYLAYIAAFLLLSGIKAYGSASSCAPGDTSLPCRLSGVLNWLEAAAVILAIILIAVIGVAIHLIRKNQINRRDGR